MTTIGYARVSTGDQHTALQLDALRKAGCEKLFEDKASGVKTDRPGLAEAVRYARDGDTLTVWKLDRLGRSMKHLIEIVTEDPSLERRSAGQDELMVVCSPRHPLAGHERLSAEELVAHDFITREPGNAIRELADDFFEAAGIPPASLRVCGEIGSLAAVKHLVRAGCGFGIASRAALRRDVGEGALVAIPLEPTLYTPLEVIFPRDRFRSRLITTFADYASAEIARLSRERAAKELVRGT